MHPPIKYSNHRARNEQCNSGIRRKQIAQIVFKDARQTQWRVKKNECENPRNQNDCCKSLLFLSPYHHQSKYNQYDGTESGDGTECGKRLDNFAGSLKKNELGTFRTFNGERAAQNYDAIVKVGEDDEGEGEEGDKDESDARASWIAPSRRGFLF